MSDDTGLRHVVLVSDDDEESRHLKQSINDFVGDVIEQGINKLVIEQKILNNEAMLISGIICRLSTIMFMLYGSEPTITHLNNCINLIEVQNAKDKNELQ